LLSSPQAFDSLRISKRKVKYPELTLATVDHGVPTSDRALGIKDPLSKKQIDALENNCSEFGITIFGVNDPRQGIVHVIGPEQGITQPGMTIVCGDSHTATHGAFGALAFGIGTSEVEHVLATQTLAMSKPKTMKVEVIGEMNGKITPKDLILGIIREIGTGGGAGHVIEYSGEVIKKMSMENRMTICNMSIEGGARAGMIAPDETTYEYLKNKNYAPKDEEWKKVIDINLTSTFLLTKYAIKKMLKNKFGRIVNITSVVGHSGNLGQSNYSASKAGIIGMSKSLAIEYAKKNITINCVSPGFIVSDMTMNIAEKVKLYLTSRIPMGKLGSGEDVSNCVAFLSSEQASYITGETIHVNGGMYMS